MPVYVFVCPDCRVPVEEYRAISERNRRGPTCPHCSRRCRRDPFQNLASPNQDYATPVLSDAMGVHASQVDEHRRRHPNVPMTDDGRVVIQNHAEHKRIMKVLGFHDRSGYN